MFLMGLNMSFSNTKDSLKMMERLVKDMGKKMMLERMMMSKILTRCSTHNMSLMKFKKWNKTTVTDISSKTSTYKANSPATLPRSN